MRIYRLITTIAFISLVLATTAFCNDNRVEILTIAYEASGEPLEYQILVAKVIQNRAIERRIDTERVCKQPKQFSCWNDGMRLKQRTEEEIENARKAWIAAKTIKSQVNIYHDASVNPYWTKSKNVYFVEQVGKLLFYYERR